MTAEQQELDDLLNSMINDSPDAKAKERGAAAEPKTEAEKPAITEPSVTMTDQELNDYLDSIIAQNKAKRKQSTEEAKSPPATSTQPEKERDTATEQEKKSAAPLSGKQKTSAGAKSPPATSAQPTKTTEEGEKDGEPQTLTPVAGSVSESPKAAQPVKEQPPKRAAEKPTVSDPDGKLQHYYEAIAERVSAEAAHVVVWEGAAKNRKIRSSLSVLVDEESYLEEDEAGRVAKLFSSQLDSEKKITEDFLPALKAFATCDWEGIFPVSLYLLAMLVHKKKKKGLSRAMSTLPTAAYYHVYGDAVTKDCEMDNWPKFVVKMPKPDKLLSPEQFRDFLLQDVTSLTTSDARNNWLFILAYSPESIYMRRL
jgi:hypothetical protein